MTEGFRVIEGGDSEPRVIGHQTVPRAVDASRYRRYDWWYRVEDDLFAKLDLGKEPIETGRTAYLTQLEREARHILKPLRTPIHRVVEFYATTMLVGSARQALPLRDLDTGTDTGLGTAAATDKPVAGALPPDPTAAGTPTPGDGEDEKGRDDYLREALWRLWDWSNFDSQLKVLKRRVAKDGIAFLKAVAPPDKPIVYMQIIKAEHVSDYKKDERGNIKWIRLDIPVEEEKATEDGRATIVEKLTYTEIWSKGDADKPGYARTWVRPRDTDENQVKAEPYLGPPKTNTVLSESNPQIGHDFVPFVAVVAMDTGEKFPRPVYDHALPLIKEANRMGTRYSELLFIYNKPHRAITGIGNDPSGRPMPAPQPPSVDSLQAPDQHTVPFGGYAAKILNNTRLDENLGGDIWYGAPGTSDIKDITPNVDFEAMRRALMDTVNEIKRELPELLYFETLDKAEISGRALRLIMSGAVDRTLEMRGNIENAIIKWDKMALTQAQVKKLPGFEADKIGVYSPDEGFKHNFEEGDIIAVSDLENEELRGRRIANAIALMQMGLSPKQALTEVGMTHLNFEEMQGVMGAVSEMTPGTGGNPGGGTNMAGAVTQGQGLTQGLQNAGKVINGQLRGSDSLFPPSAR